MSDAPMPLRDEDVQRIGDYVKPWLREYVADLMPRRSDDSKLLERMLHIEEELRLQRELMDSRFGSADQRFETMQTSIDQRFETMQTSIDQRFETMRSSIDQRFETMQTSIDQRFETMQTSIGQRFELLQTSTDKRFAAVDKRFDDVHQSFTRTQWLIGIGFVMITAAVTVFGFIG